MIRPGRAVLLGALAAGCLTPSELRARPGASAVAPERPDSVQRRAILTALRPAIEARLGPNVEFVVAQLEVGGGWAFVMANPQRRGGGAIDGRAYFGDDWEEMDGLTVTALLRLQDRRWKLVDHAIGATDAWYCGVAPTALGLGC